MAVIHITFQYEMLASRERAKLRAMSQDWARPAPKSIQSVANNAPAQSDINLVLLGRHTTTYSVQVSVLPKSKTLPSRVDSFPHLMTGMALPEEVYRGRLFRCFTSCERPRSYNS